MKPDDAHGLSEYASRSLYELEAMFKAIEKMITSDNTKEAERIARIGAYYAMDHGNYFDCQREEIERQEKEVQA